jgi:hypothetical protein
VNVCVEPVHSQSVSVEPLFAVALDDMMFSTSHCRSDAALAARDFSGGARRAKLLNDHQQACERHKSAHAHASFVVGFVAVVVAVVVVVVVNFLGT